jgi:hypothetical protein
VDTPKVINRKSQKKHKDEFGVKIVNVFYDIDSGMVFCLLDAPDRYAVEKHHSKFGVKCDRIIPVKMTSEYNSPGQAGE